MDHDAEYHIDLFELFISLIQKWWIIALSALILGAAACGYTYFFVTPIYQSDIMVYVNSSSVSFGDTSLTLSDLSTAKTLVNTYSVILKSRLTLAEINKAAETNYSYNQLSSMISCVSVNDTEIFRVVVRHSDPQVACKIANAVAEVLPIKIPSIIKGSSASIVDYAVVAGSRSSPSYSRNTVIGVFIGALVSAAAIVALHLTNNKVNSEDWLLDTWKDDIPLLSVIPDANESKKGYRYNKYGKYKYRYRYKYNYYGYGNQANKDNE